MHFNGVCRGCGGSCIRRRVIDSGGRCGNQFFLFSFYPVDKDGDDSSKTPIERLEFGLRWDACRLAYFTSIGHSKKVAFLSAKLQKLEEDLRRESPVQR